ncbi:SUKH-4 family immunity protein [Nonomuraea sp. NPDC050404]|uniref:SUKH-4 family immunity protein n=1 Tax=Nonomuraea sp. NPDC050404 TaxID=3155783 RepID=UPI003411D3E9
MDLPRDLPPDLHTAFRVVGLPWPDLRSAGFDGVLAELHDHPQAGELRDLVLELRAGQREFFQGLRDLADGHGGDNTMRLIRHKDRPCVQEVRAAWAGTAARMAEHHAAAGRLAREAVQGLRVRSEVPAVPDYLAGDLPAWAEQRPEAGIRREVTAGRAPAAQALLRWHEDPHGPRICVVTGSPGSGKTHLLAWFTNSDAGYWSGYDAYNPPGTEATEAAACLRGLSVAEAVRDLARQLKIDAGRSPRQGDDLTGLGRDLLITIADPHRGADPEAVLAGLVRPLAADRRVRLLVECEDAAAVLREAPEEPVFVLDLDDPRCTDRAAFTRWYEAELAGNGSPFGAHQLYPSPAPAAVAARARGADPGPGLPLAERVARAWLDGVSPAARAAVGTLALTFAPIGPYTWRLLHCGRHRDDPDAAARAVEEAAALLPLAEPGVPAYAVGLPALAEAVAPPTEAHRELVAVVRGWPVSEELPHPSYVQTYLAAHERVGGGGEREAIEPLPLRRPAVAVTRELLESLYGEAGVIRTAPGELHPAITHEPTRRFLTEVGLPAQGVQGADWTQDEGRFTVSVAESGDAVEELRAALPCDVAAVFAVDDLHTWYLFLDGATGLVHEVHEDLETTRVTHRSIESYAYFAYVIQRDRQLWCGKDAPDLAPYWCADDLSLELHTYEPGAMEGEEAYWPPTLQDYTLM